MATVQLLEERYLFKKFKFFYESKQEDILLAENILRNAEKIAPFLTFFYYL